MTENEAIKPKIAIVGGGRGAGRTLKAHIELLEELEAYRAIGTVRQVQDFITDWRKYRAFGTLEELQALKEKSDMKNRCKDCAGCTVWKCDCSNIRAKAIDEFAKRIKEVYPIMENDLFTVNDKLQENIDKIAEQMKGSDTDA